MKKIVALVLFISSFVFCTERVTVTCSFEAVADGFEDVEITTEMIIMLDDDGEVNQVRNIDGSWNRKLDVGEGVFIFNEKKYLSDEMVLINENIINKSITKKDPQQFVYNNFIRNSEKIYGTHYGPFVLFFIKKGIVVDGRVGEILENEYGRVVCYDSNVGVVVAN